MKTFLKTILISFLFLNSLGGWSPLPVWAEARITVFVSILPQKFFIEQIGKDRVDVRVMVEPGADPHTYEPKPRQMVAISKAKAYFAIGVPFETIWLKKIASINPKMKLVHTDHGIQKLPMRSHQDHEEEGHTDHHEDQNRGHLDPHIWLSPPLVMLQARSILMALQEIDPVHRSGYEADYRAFMESLLVLDAEIRTFFYGKQGRPFLVFHPSWGYFAQAYGLKQIPLEIEGKAPKPAQLKEIITSAREHHIKVIFVQPQFSKSAARQVARSIGAQLILADPLAENWLENLKQQAEQFGAALR